MSFRAIEIASICQKATKVSQKKERRGFCKDQHGAWIQQSQYGNRNSRRGWKTDRIRPSVSGGSSAHNNLRPVP